MMEGLPNDGKSRNLKVAIVGGGICGLLCAIVMKKNNFDVDIYETAHRLGEVGAGVGFGANAVRALRAMGILDHVMTKVDPSELQPRPFKFLSGMEGHEVIYIYPANSEDVGLGIHRAKFLDALIDLVEPDKIHYNKRCVAVIPGEDSSSGQIKFADGTSVESDIIIGADGIRSCVRAYVVNGSTEETEGHTRVAFTNTRAYRGLVPAAVLKEAGVKEDLTTRPHCYCGEGKHIIAFPIKSGEIINLVCFTCDRSVPMGSRPLPSGQPWVMPRTNAELIQEYSGWGSDVQNILKCIEKPSVWSIHFVQPPLENYTRSVVALIGDAAHAMLPHLGAGAGQGVEDIYVLSRLLSNPSTTKSNIQEVFLAYDMVRRPRANKVLLDSTRVAEIYEGYGPSGPTIEGMRKDLVGIWEDVLHHDIEADIRAAESWLVEKQIFTR